uniref:Uncharacterized protein n=1 Tax=Solibacter usitatus (strain Ellin6076) TaxID=234267 RepID=Q023K4_SOLUE
MDVEHFNTAVLISAIPCIAFHSIGQFNISSSHSISARNPSPRPLRITPSAHSILLLQSKRQGRWNTARTPIPLSKIFASDALSILMVRPSSSSMESPVTEARAMDHVLSLYSLFRKSSRKLLMQHPG